MTLPALLGQLRQVASTDTGEVFSAGTARRLACQAGILPLVLGGQRQPLDLGRQTRLFTEAQRAIVGTRYHTCAAEGCDRPVAWSELHHLRAWADGGTTDLTNAIPLCGTHHRRIHHPNQHHTIIRRPDGTIAIRFGQRPGGT